MAAMPPLPRAPPSVPLLPQNTSHRSGATLTHTARPFAGWTVSTKIDFPHGSGLGHGPLSRAIVDSCRGHGAWGRGGRAAVAHGQQDAWERKSCVNQAQYVNAKQTTDFIFGLGKCGLVDFERWKWKCDYLGEIIVAWLAFSVMFMKVSSSWINPLQ